MKKKISSAHVPDPPPQTWSNCLVVGNQVFVAGMVARGAEGAVGGDSMYAQAQAIFAKMKHLMEAAGGTMDDIVKVLIFVTDIKRREEVWKARREVFSGDFPVSTLVEIRALAAPEFLVEIEAIGIAYHQRHTVELICTCLSADDIVQIRHDLHTYIVAITPADHI